MCIHPSVFTINMEMFNCVDVNGSKRLSKDIETLWFNVSYIYFFLFSIIVILFFCFEVTLTIWIDWKVTQNICLIIKQRKDMNFCINDINLVAIGGKLLSFSEKCSLYLWLPLEVYLEQASNDLLFVGLIAFIFFHVVSNPFLKREFNLWETFLMSIILLFVYCAVFFFSESANESGYNKTKNNFVFDDTTIKIVEIIICTIIVFYIYIRIYFLLYLYRFLVKKFSKWFGVSNNFLNILFYILYLSKKMNLH